ncbi:MAG: cupin domain-containing protein [Nanoarchaeota archaeon]
MTDGVRIMDVLGLPLAANVCGQRLREVVSLETVSVAHVLMDPHAQSLYHVHDHMDEVYYVLRGRGCLVLDGDEHQLSTHSYLHIPRGVPHMFRNEGDDELEHLVYASPPFDPSDVRLVADAPPIKGVSIMHGADAKAHPLVLAGDGVALYELFATAQAGGLGFQLALGKVPAAHQSRLHTNMLNDEFYFIVDGSGAAQVAGDVAQIVRGTGVYVPKGVPRAFQAYESLEVLCCTSPQYDPAGLMLL